MLKKKNKRAVSTLIVVLFLILLAFASIIFLYSILKTLREKSEEIPPASSFTENIEIVKDKTNFLTDPIKITITRKAGELDYSALKVVFHNAERSYMHTIRENPAEGIYLPKPLETKTYLVSVGNKISNIEYFVVYIVYEYNDKEYTSPLGERFDILGVKCKEVYDLINSRTSIADFKKFEGIFECGYKDKYGNGIKPMDNYSMNYYYEPKIDFNDDKDIDSKDIQEFSQRNGDESWCSQQLTKQRDECSEYALYILLKLIAKSWGDCKMTNYDLKVDFDKDGKVDLPDLVELARRWDQTGGYIEYGDLWAKEKMQDNTKINDSSAEHYCTTKNCPAELCCQDPFCEEL